MLAGRPRDILPAMSRSERWLEGKLRSGAPGGSWVRVHGGSMEPNLFDGDRVLIVPLATEAPSPGDVVLTRAPSSSLVVHRFVSMQSGSVDHAR